MKKIVFLLVFLFPFVANSQTAQYGKITSNGTYASYIPADGNKISIGDTLTIGKPSGPTQFLYIQQGGKYVAPWLSGKDVVITKIKSYGKPKRGYILFVQFKGYGMLPVSIQYDNALKNGEVINPHANNNL